MKKLLQGLRWFWTKFPFAPLLVLVLALQIIEEAYPFSHFPMYQRFDEQATYLFITNEADTPVPLQTHFSYKASRVKKNFKSALRKVAESHGRKLETATEADMREAGDKVLRELFKKANPRKLAPIAAQEVKLWHGIVTLKDGKMLDERMFLAARPVDRAALEAAAAAGKGESSSTGDEGEDPGADTDSDSPEDTE